ncbi:MAG: YqhA family protein [Deltaproteobacteria bacterium]|nr:YqhA family protein [Deltaproteobacteria bacterium]
MKELLSASRYLIFIPVLLSLIASAGAFVWGAYRTIEVLYHLFHAMFTGTAGAVIELIAVMDTFLIATALLIFALGLYELFIDELKFPEWLVIHNLHDLKAKLGSVIILVMAVAFLEHLATWSDPWGTFLFAAAITLVSGVLIAFGYFGEKD